VHSSADRMMTCLPRRAPVRHVSAVARGVVLLHHAGRDAATVTDRQAVLLRPGPDLTRALPTALRPPSPVAGARPALRACSIYGASCLPNAAAFLPLRSISYSLPSKANRTISSAGPPVRSSSRATVTFWAIPASSTACCLQRIQASSSYQPHRRRSRSIQPAGIGPGLACVPWSALAGSPRSVISLATGSRAHCRRYGWQPGRQGGYPRRTGLSARCLLADMP